MWNVKGEAGRLRRVLISNTSYRTKISPPTNWWFPQNVIPEKYSKAWEMLPKLLVEEGVKCYDVPSLVKEIVEKATLTEKKEIIKTVWGSEQWEKKPKANDLHWMDVVYGYPPKPYFDDKKDKVILPDHNVASIYQRDPAFMTQIGFVLGKKIYNRQGNRKPKILRVIHKFNTEFNKNMEIVYDASSETEFNERLEGGDNIVVDEETIAHGCGHNSNTSGTMTWLKAMFERDTDEEIKNIVVVSMPTGRYSFTHLDTTFNMVDREKAVVMPYAHISKLSDSLPEGRNLLLKLVQAKREEHESKFLPLDRLPNLSTIRFVGSCKVYRRGVGGKVVKASNEDSYVDWLIENGKLDADGIISVGGNVCQYESELMYLISAWQEQNRCAANICQLEPGKIIAYDVNSMTLANLREHGIEVKEMPSIYLDMGGGPHCMTCPIERDPL